MKKWFILWVNICLILASTFAQGTCTDPWPVKAFCISNGSALSSTESQCFVDPLSFVFHRESWFNIVLEQPTEYIFFSPNRASLPGENIGMAEVFAEDCNGYLTCIDFAADTSLVMLPAGNLLIRAVGTAVLELCCQPADESFCDDPPVIDPVDPVTACYGFTLPPITGTNLSGSQRYFDQSGGRGQSYFPGDVISSSGTIYAIDQNGTCSSEISFEVTIEEGELKKLSGFSATDWFLSTTWLGTTMSIPGLCDSVVIAINLLSDKVIVDNPAEEAVCRTLEVQLGAQLEVILGSRLSVGH
ncbi:MAG: hypothetical protein KDC53_12660 [Saprospiraceae bacterium]|nr:hypothetical protein [Saprospiraceae bacterium]